MQFNTKITII